MQESDIESRLVELETEFKSVSRQLESIASDLKQILQTTSRIAIIDERQAMHRSDIDRAFTSISDLSTKHEILADYTKGWVNLNKGGWLVGFIMFGIIQGLTVYGAKSLIDEVKSLHDTVIVLQSKVR